MRVKVGVKVGVHLEVGNAQLVAEHVGLALEEGLAPLVEGGHQRRGRGGLVLGRPGEAEDGVDDAHVVLHHLVRVRVRAEG